MRFSATRRVARTIYMGSAPTLDQTNRGIDDSSIKLGCVQPGESPATFGDALRRLSTKAMYLVEDRGQYWYSLTQTIGRTAEGRKESRFLDDHADEEIRRRLLAVRERGDFAGVHWAPRGPAEVPDDDEARLVVLGPDHPHAAGTEVTDARAMVDAILAERAAGPRTYRNMLVFVAPDKARLEELRDAARWHLAWKSVHDESEELNLDALERRQAETQTRHFDEAVTQRIGETFIWMLTPRQDAGKPEVSWEQTRVSGTEPIPVRVSKKLKVEEGLIGEYSGARLRMDLDRVPLWKDDHIGVKELWSYYAQYLYLSRLRDSKSLAEAVQNGVASTTWEQDAFAYADAWDEAAGRYVGLVAGSVPSVLVDGVSVVVKPEAARRQLDEEAPVSGPNGEPAPGPAPAPGPGEPAPPEPREEAIVRRFFGVKTLDPQRVSRDADQVGAEIVKHLVGLVGADVEVKLEISANVQDGVPDDVVRTVTENAKTLKFDQHGFEES
jgi:hypothetical protein